MKKRTYAGLALAGLALYFIVLAIWGDKPTCREFIERYEKNPAYMGQTAEQHQHYSECKAATP